MLVFTFTCKQSVFLFVVSFITSAKNLNKNKKADTKQNERTKKIARIIFRFVIIHRSFRIEKRCQIPLFGCCKDLENKTALTANVEGKKWVHRCHQDFHSFYSSVDYYQSIIANKCLTFFSHIRRHKYGGEHNTCVCDGCRRLKNVDHLQCCEKNENSIKMLQIC